MALKKLKGQNFRAFVGGGAVPEASSCQVSITGNMEDAKTKDSEGSFGQEQMTSRSWSVQVDYQPDSSEPPQSIAGSLINVITRFLSDTPTQVGWDETATTPNTKNRTPQNAAFARSGNALLNDFTIQANNRANITISEQWTGTGALA